MRLLRAVPIVLASVAALAAPLHADVFFDIDFESPPHTVGQPPVLGVGDIPRDVPTRIRSGTPVVVASMAGLGQSLRIDSFFDSEEDEVALYFWEIDHSAYDFFRFEFTVAIEELAFDGGFVANLGHTSWFEQYVIRFHWVDFVGGVIEAQRYGPNPAIPIGTWEPDIPVRLAVEHLRPAGTWTFFVDGTEALATVWGGIGTPTVGFYTESGNGTPGIVVGLDDILVSGEPGAVAVESRGWASIKALYR